MPIRPFTSLLLAALFATPAFATPASAPSRVLTGADLFNIEAASDPQISPDGRLIAYVRQSNDIMSDRTQSSIWLIDVASGAQTPLITGPGSHAQAHWSPDGSKLAYISSSEEKADAQLYVRWMKTGANARITGLPTTPHGIAWSPDGSRIAYAMFVPDEGIKLGKALEKPEGAKWAEPLQIIDKVVYRTDGGGYEKPGYEQIFWVSADGGAPAQLTFGARNAGGRLSWSHDGKSVIFSANLSDDWQRALLNSDIHEVAIDTLAVHALTHRNGPDDAPAVSPDGQSIAYVGFDDKYLGYQNQQLSVMKRDGSGSRVLTTNLDRSVGAPTWAENGRAIYVDYGDHGSTRVARVSLDGSTTTVAEGLTDAGELDRPYSGGDFSIARDGTIAYTGGSTQRPPDVWIARDGKARQLTRLNDSLFASKTLGKVEKLSVTSFDGLAVDAWLVTPPNFDPSKKYPLILEIHGGPFAAYGPSFSTDDQLYAAAGYAVVYANPRGSSTYGETFGNKIDKDYPSHDYDDLMSTVDAAIAKGFIDKDNLFVTGGSGGGVLTAWIVGKTDRFRAAASQKPVINWSSFALTSDMTPIYARYWFGKYPWEDIATYWAHSPLSLVGNVKTPTLLVVGTNDLRTPDSEAEQFYEALQLRGIPTALIKVPGANHGGLTARPSQSAAKASAILAWFERYRNNAAIAGASP